MRVRVRRPDGPHVLEHEDQFDHTPRPQSLHVLLLADALNWPAAHVVHCAAPGELLYLPAAHALHTDASVAPVLVLYWPAAHDVHSKPPSVVLPYLPAGHGVQLWLPVVSWNLPGSHSVQEDCIKCPKQSWAPAR